MQIIERKDYMEVVCEVREDVIFEFVKGIEIKKEDICCRCAWVCGKKCDCRICMHEQEMIERNTG